MTPATRIENSPKNLRKSTNPGFKTASWRVYLKNSVLYTEKKVHVAALLVRIFALFFLTFASELCAKLIQQPYRISASHIEPKGIGYNEGYTSLALFFAWQKKSCDWILFWDARAHVFNHGKMAANSGMGVRYRGVSRLYGINSYYDYRQSHANYNQISFGLESLGKRWDFRINGYLPLGRREKTYDTSFAGVQNRVLLFSHKREFALSCIQAESTIHIDEVGVPCSLAIGSYWMNGHNQSAWGGEVRFNMDFCRYIWLEGNASYDHFFKWIAQGRLGFTVAFGPSKKNGGLTMQSVSRREIIPLLRDRFKTPAIHPETGESYLY